MEKDILKTHFKWGGNERHLTWNSSFKQWSMASRHVMFGKWQTAPLFFHPWHFTSKIKTLINYLLSQLGTWDRNHSHFHLELGRATIKSQFQYHTWKLGLIIFHINPLFGSPILFFLFFFFFFFPMNHKKMLWIIFIIKFKYSS